jgi:uncharacterized protein YjbJ (UPF0337 family)
MNSDIIKGNWKELKGVLRTKWGKLTDSDYEQIAGNKDRLIGLLQQRYGYQRDQAEREVDELERDQGPSAGSA